MYVREVIEDATMRGEQRARTIQTGAIQKSELDIGIKTGSQQRRETRTGAGKETVDDGDDDEDDDERVAQIEVD